MCDVTRTQPNSCVATPVLLLTLTGRLRVALFKLLQSKQWLVVPPSAYHFLWVTDFPLFDLDACELLPATSTSAAQRWALKGLASTHHPFTAAHPSDHARLLRVLHALGLQPKPDSASAQGKPEPAPAPAPAPESEWSERSLLQALGSIRAQHYDLVLNGVELGGGSIRIHQPNLQARYGVVCGAALCLLSCSLL
jgi:aspartyl-tRNA synthetase